MSHINPDPNKVNIGHSSNISGASSVPGKTDIAGTSGSCHSCNTSHTGPCNSVRTGMTNVGMGGGDIIDLIKKDNRLIERLFEQYREALTKEQRTTLLAQLIKEICMSINTREVVVYPVLRDEISKDLADRSFCEDTEIERVLYDLDSLVNTPDEPKVDLLVHKCKDLALAHIKEEEAQILPQLRNRLGEAKLKEMCEEWLKKKPHAVTRPHPSAPKEGILGSAAKFGARAIDSIKDAARFGSSSHQENVPTH